MSVNWLVAVDESDVSSYAFHYAVSKMGKEDHLFLMNVHDEPTMIYGGYTTPEILSSLNEVHEKKSKKILVHYGHKAKELGANKFTLMKGASSHAGELLCRAVKQYNIHQVVVGRRSLSGIQRFFVGSTSQYLIENAECNVVVVKLPGGTPEEHVDRQKVIQMEEDERLRRVQEEIQMESLEKNKGSHESQQAALEKIHQEEEKERERRIEETKRRGLQDMIHVFSFKDELLQKTHHT